MPVATESFSVNRSDAIKIFEKAGLKNASSWPKDELLARLRSLPGQFEENDDLDLGDRRLQKIYDQVRELVDQSELFELINDLPAKRGATKATKAGRAAKADGPAKTGRAAKATKTRKVRASADGGNGGVSLSDAAVTVLKATRGAMRCKEIIAACHEKNLWHPPGGGKTPEASLSARIITEIEKKGGESRFRRVGRGLYEFNRPAK